jgi:hypothetical protein
MSAEDNKSCGCSCICDPTVARVLDQTMARFNERASYASTNQMDNQTLLLSMFQSQAQNALEQTPMTELAASLAQLMSIVKGNFSPSA